MIALLLSCSISWSQNDSIWDQGDCPNDDFSYYSCDSALISIEDLKVANAKMLELKYEKEINCTLLEIIKTDSAIINSLKHNLYSCEIACEEEISKYKKQRNTAIFAGTSTSLLFLILFIVAL